jgi:hypothetical protein
MQVLIERSQVGSVWNTETAILTLNSTAVSEVKEKIKCIPSAKNEAVRPTAPTRPRGVPLAPRLARQTKSTSQQHGAAELD